MNWRNHIQADPDVLVGKPAIKGTRLAVEFLLGLYEAGWSEQQILENYPRLSRDDLRAIFAYLQDCIKDEMIFNRA